MSTETKEQATKRLRRIAGQVNGILKMVEDDRYCVDVVTQISAARAALGKVATVLLDNHVRTCVTSALTRDDEAERERITAELISVFDRYLAS